MCKNDVVKKLMVKIVVCGSYSDVKVIEKVISELKARGFDVFPSQEYLKELGQAFEESDSSVVSDLTMKKRRQINSKFIDEIRECDVVFVFNEKNGEEYIGPGTLMQMGYAVGLKKPIFFYREPHIEEVLSLAGALVLQVFVD